MSLLISVRDGAPSQFLSVGNWTGKGTLARARGLCSFCLFLTIIYIAE